MKPYFEPLIRRGLLLLVTVIANVILRSPLLLAATTDGHEVNNGGLAVFVRGEGLVLLDLFEAKLFLSGGPSISIPTPPSDLEKRTFEELRRTIPLAAPFPLLAYVLNEASQRYPSLVNRIFDHLTKKMTWQMAAEILPYTQDNMITMLSPELQYLDGNGLVQVAIQIDKPQEHVVWISPIEWARFRSPEHQVGLILHEALISIAARPNVDWNYPLRLMVICLMHKPELDLAAFCNEEAERIDRMPERIL